MLRLHWASKVHGFQMTVFTHPPVNDLRFLRSMDCVDGNFIGRLPPFLLNVKILKQLVFEISLHCNKDPAPCITFFTVGMEWMYFYGPLSHKDLLEELVINNAVIPNAWKL